MVEKIKLQLFLSRSGVCSRRKAFDLIKKGCVKVNGAVICEPAYQVDNATDTVSLRGSLKGRGTPKSTGKKISLKKYEYILLNKPRGVTTTKRDRFAGRTVLDLIPRNLEHLNPVGRLDKDTTGLLLLTNDGDLAYRLTHPRFKINKTYRLTPDMVLSNKECRRIEQGIRLDDGVTAPCRLKHLGNKDIELTIYEGRKRQIKRMFAKLGYRVVSLERIKEGALSLGTLPLGEWRRLSENEVKRLLCEVKNR